MTSLRNGVSLHRTLRPILSRRYWGLSLGLWLVIGCFTVVCVRYANFVPMWDGWVYSDECIVRGVRAPFALNSFNCFGHPSFAYIFPIVLLQYLDPGNVTLLHLAIWILAVLGIFSFYRVSEQLFGGWSCTRELVLLTAIFAFMPLFACNCINPNPDFGIVVFTLALLWSLIGDRPFLQLLFGLCLVFCKETGILIYVACVATYLILYAPRPLLGARAKLYYFTRRFHLAIPMALFGSYILTRMKSDAWWGIHNSADAIGIFRCVTSFDLLDKNFLSFTYGSLVNNFNWVLTLLVVAYCLKVAWCRVWGSTHPVNKNQVLTFVVTLATFLAVTRYKTSSNYRYVAVTGPLLALSAYWALLRLFRQPLLRTAILSLALVLIGISNWRTLDPIPKEIYGTFKFGEREMLPIGLAMGDFAFPGYDQLQYNFEFAYLDDAINEVFRVIDPEKNVFAVTKGSDFGILTRILKSGHHRTLRFKDTLDLQYLEAGTLKDQATKPETIHYIFFPNMGESARDSDLEQLRAIYDVKETRRYGHAGHFLEVYTMVRKAS